VIRKPIPALATSRPGTGAPPSSCEALVLVEYGKTDQTFEDDRTKAYVTGRMR
jgi:hypothetical protein